jgi:hypothetical protein
MFRRICDGELQASGISNACAWFWCSGRIGVFAVVSVVESNKTPATPTTMTTTKNCDNYIDCFLFIESPIAGSLFFCKLNISFFKNADSGLKLLKLINFLKKKA